MKIKSPVVLTRRGFIFIAFLCAMTIASTNYRNNMAYLFTFSMLSIFLTSIPFSYYNLKGVQIRSVEAHRAFAGEEVFFSVTVENPGSREKSGVTAGFSAKGITSDFKDIPPGDSATFEISMEAGNRGEYSLPEIVIHSSYPFGFIKGISRLKVEQRYLVFPSPGGRKELPSPREGMEGGNENRIGKGGDDFSGYRNFRSGESLRHVDWKAFARGREMLIKQFDGEGEAAQWLLWMDVSGMGTEKGVSQLTRWVLEAHKENIPFGFDIPGFRLKVASDSLHTMKALGALAVFNG